MPTSRIIREIERNAAPGPCFETAAGLPEQPPRSAAVKLIAYYLPQFHRIPENDAWWGAGFTEWTNVTKALPRYEGHYQPRLPGELGFYDLSDVDAIRAQVALARRGGIEGFCIHNYWFSGKTLLDAPLESILAHKDIDIRFCVNWANENWSRRWDGSEDQILMGQEYSAEADDSYADYLARIVSDERYIRVGGRPLVMVYRPNLLPDARATVARWKERFRRHGLPEPYLVTPQFLEMTDPGAYGFDAVAGFPPHGQGWATADHGHRVRLLDPRFEGRVLSYGEMAARTLADRPKDYRVFPGVCPAWDNQARRPNKGASFFGSSPRTYGRWLREASRQALEAPPEERLVFINAWNEWAEGAYLEPDRHYGYAYLAETRRVLDGLSDPTAPVDGGGDAADRLEGSIPLVHPVLAGFRRGVRKLRRMLRPN